MGFWACVSASANHYMWANSAMNWEAFWGWHPAPFYCAMIRAMGKSREGGFLELIVNSRSWFYIAVLS